MKLLTPILIVVLLAGAVCAQGWPDARVVHMQEGGTASFVNIGGVGYLISCAHRTIDKGISIGHRTAFTCHDGKRGNAKVIAVTPLDLRSDPLMDCAIYSFTGIGTQVNAFEISKRQLQPGDQVWVSGFPITRNGSYFCRTTTVISDDDSLYLNGPSTPGESGGPIINSEGELVGTLSVTTEQGFTICCGRGPAEQLCQDVQAAWDNCANGNCESGGWYSQPAPYRPPVQRPPVQRPPQPQTPPIKPPVTPPAQPPVVAGTPGAPGEPGKIGPAGPQGPAGDPGKVVEAVKPQLASISSSINALSLKIEQNETNLTPVVNAISINTAAVTALSQKIDELAVKIPPTPPTTLPPPGDTAPPKRKIYLRVVPKH